ncbi:hypothetical protein BKK50_01905 [Rodentibacter rarus]|uniref:UPF0208 membrane protein BKK50_01905 n=1 Tax=Rodentibacter rarus TaxID=1908260 RepID=A0A1V3IQN6_9PAST|nr:terminus macrodomain insulation protein YfbV [Rodentibacter rarus]OOF44582.1 hypothetical protein BKK50_01905 [Rodentibacter rarus]
MSFFAILKQGQIYLNTWPKEAKLGMIFPENRVIKTTNFAQKTMPLIAVFAVVWQQLYVKQDIMALSTAILTALFALALPLQGLYWLGKRAETPLSGQSAVWFYDICERLKKINEPIPIVEGTPKYQHLAEVLRKAEQRLASSFWQEI